MAMRCLSIAVLVCCIAALTPTMTNAQSHSEPKYVAEPQTFPLWDHAAPGAVGNTDEDKPSLTNYSPVMPGETRTAVIVAPGGSYHFLASNHEGRQVANWLNAMGVTAFVLKYRLGPRYHHPIELGDAQRAIRLVRSRAAEFGVAPDRIGIMGFSAGGHLTTNLLGENADVKLREELSAELHVTPQTPPTFLFTTSEDTLVPPENSIAFYLALHKAGVPAEMHVFEKGAHGVGLDLADASTGEWPALLRNWLRVRGLLTARP
jgi:acetyl esterase/lipase